MYLKDGKRGSRFEIHRRWFFPLFVFVFVDDIVGNDDVEVVMAFVVSAAFVVFLSCSFATNGVVASDAVLVPTDCNFGVPSVSVVLNAAADEDDVGVRHCLFSCYC